MYTLVLTKYDETPRASGFGDQVRDLLFLTLETSVRLRLMAEDFGNWNVFKSRQEYLMQTLCEKGDLILFRSDKKGESAKAFNALAEALSYLTLVPGGVRFLGWSWIAVRDGEQREGIGTEIDIALKVSVRKAQLEKAFGEVKMP